jgi:plastocyanin
MSFVKEAGPAIVLFLLVGVTALALNPIYSIPKAHAATQNISLSGNRSSGWLGSTANPTITVTQGDSVALTTSSADGYPHMFYIDVNGNGVPNCNPDKCAMQVPPTSTYPFSADFGTGMFTYYCSFHPTTMKGTFIVQAAPTTPDFTISPSQSSLSVVQGSSGTATITLTSQNGFAGNVNLTATVSSSGPTVTFSPSTVPLTSGATGTSTLTVTTSSGLYSSTSTGSYTVTITANGSASLSHTTTISVTVTSSSSSPAANNIPAYVWVVAGIAILAVAVIVGYAVLRRRPGKQT